MKKLFYVLTVALALSAQSAQATLNVFACEPEWGSLTQELGGDKVSVYNATQALQDVHRVQAKPSLIAKARNADLLVCTGLELEIGWLPMVLRQAGNATIQPGKPGYFEAGIHVPRLEIPARLDRADGDVHALGNPHIQTDPHNIAKVAEALAKRLEEVDPANASFYQTRYRSFAQRWNEAMQRWESQATALNGVAIVEHHKGFPYLIHWLGLEEVATLEPKPGVEPSSGHLTEIMTKLQQRPARMVIRAAYNDGRASAWLAEKTGIKTVVLPFTVGGTDRATDLFGLFDDTLQRLLEAAR